MRTGDREANGARTSFEIVFICTGNRARSPFAAALLRQHLTELPVTVKSRGTYDVRNAPALTAAARAGRSFGVELAEHRSRPLAPGELRGTDLTIGFEPFHVATAVVEGGASSERTFMLTELAHAFDEVALVAPRDADIESLLVLADGRRRSSGSLARTIADPVGGSDRLMMATFMEIDDLVARVASRLIGAVEDRTGC